LFDRIYTEIFPSKGKGQGKGTPKSDVDTLQQFAYKDPSLPVDKYGYLDGDLDYRMLQPMVDIFIEKEASFNALLKRSSTSGGSGSGGNNNNSSLNPVDTPTFSEYLVKLPSKEEFEMSEVDKRLIQSTLPPAKLLYRRRRHVEGAHSQNGINKFTGRYPIVSLGYPFLKRVVSDKAQVKGQGHGAGDPNPNNRAPGIGLSMSNAHSATQTNPTSYYKGEPLGGYYIGREKAMRMWSLNKDNIDVPFVAIYVNNENWGYLSTGVPGRTKDWEQEDKWFRKTMYEFLDHPMTLALVVNQHHNFTHPKIINYPLGLPPIEVAGVNGIANIMHNAMDTIHTKKVNKTQMVYTAYSSNGDRPRIMECIQKKLGPAGPAGEPGRILQTDTSTDGLWGHIEKSRDDYYQTLGRSRFTIGLPGSIGYDTYRYVCICIYVYIICV